VKKWDFFPQMKASSERKEFKRSWSRAQQQKRHEKFDGDQAEKHFEFLVFFHFEIKFQKSGCF
jgi:hypothetical protein